MHGDIQKILVVGGGTAGWLAACHLARRLNSHLHGATEVSLVESPDIPVIGVGEGTVPAIRNSLLHLGIRETDLIRQCDATFKQSIKFIDWVKEPDTKGSDYYHHLFDYPDILNCNLTPYWLSGQLGEQSFADSVSVQGRICDLGMGPKLMTHPEFQGASEYAYHFDAAKFGQLLSSHGINKLGVKHIRAHIEQVNLRPDGSIASLNTRQAGELKADLYVDASGFNARLLGQAMAVPLKDKSHVLLADTALAVQVPYDNPQQPIPCSTLATAKEAGWIWDIGLTTRRGLGYVYSSSHTSHEQAEQCLRQHIGQAAEKLDCRRIPMQVGYREQFWKHNCVAIGLSQGFVEPLEATGLLMFDITARMLAEQLPGAQQQMPGVAARFNQRVAHAWDKVIDFIKLHYCLSRRNDSEFWYDNRQASSIPDSLQQNLQYWRYQLPSHYDFTDVSAIFNLENYLYVLYGMHFQTQVCARPGWYDQSMQAKQYYQQITARADQARQQLLPHRELLSRIAKYGLQRV